MVKKIKKEKSSRQKSFYINKDILGLLIFIIIFHINYTL